MNTYYLQDLSRESKEVGEKLQELTKEEVHWNNILCAAPLAELKLKEIKRKKKEAQMQLDLLEKQSKEARFQLMSQDVIVVHIGGVK